MNYLFLKKLLPVITPFLSARVQIGPCPGWHFGKGEPLESENDGIVGLRKEAWRQIKPLTKIKWLYRLKLYLYPQNESCRTIFFTGYYEPNEFFVLDRMLKKGMTFIDIGANMGLYTMFGSKKVAKKGTVIGIEPSSREFQRLNANVNLNSLNNVLLFNVAICNCEADVDLLVADEEHSGHNTMGAFGYDILSDGSEKVRTMRLDEIVRQRKLLSVDVIKMDVEGAELFALQGAVETIERFQPLLLVELSDHTLKYQGCSSAQVLDFLMQYRYKVYGVNNEIGLPEPLPRQEVFDGVNIFAVPPRFQQYWLW